VTAVNDAGESPASAQVSATPSLTKPLPPANLVATPGDGRVTLTWPASAGATSYNVMRSLVSAGPFVAIANVPATTYADTNVANGTTYFYYVTALNDAGTSDPSKKVSATPAAVPQTPTGLTASPGAGPGLVNLSWNPSAGATGYRVKRATVSGGPYASKKVTTTSATDTVTSGRRYYYVVAALNGTAESADSAEVTIVGP
jgi:cellulose 1,4-beta-cellobiosidase